MAIETLIIGWKSPHVMTKKDERINVSQRGCSEEFKKKLSEDKMVVLSKTSTSWLALPNRERDIGGP